MADPGLGFGDLSLVNNFHLHNSVVIYIRTPHLSGHSCMCVYAKTEY